MIRETGALFVLILGVVACRGSATFSWSGHNGATSGRQGTDEGSVVAEGSSESSGSGSTGTLDGVGSSSSSSTGGLGLLGPGSGPSPPCDRGELEGSVAIRSSDQVEDIAGYTTMTGWLEINGSDLVCLSFLACLESVGHDVRIYNNPVLRTLAGTDAIAEIGLRTVASPPADKDGSIVITDNPALKDVDGFNGLEQVRRSLVVADNDALGTISGFAALEWIVFDLVVTRNPRLENLDGLKGLRALEDCQVDNNPDLCISEVYAVCGDLEVGPSGGVTANNMAGC